MVDFGKHLKNTHQAIEENLDIIRGTLISWIKRDRTDEITQRECEWEISPYAAYGGTSTTFKITKGGATGYESFTIQDADGKLNLHTLLPIFADRDDGYWCACMGSGGWDRMIVDDSELRVAIQQWLDASGIDLPKEIA